MVVVEIDTWKGNRSVLCAGYPSVVCRIEVLHCEGGDKRARKMLYELHCARFHRREEEVYVSVLGAGMTYPSCRWTLKFNGLVVDGGEVMLL